MTNEEFLLDMLEYYTGGPNRRALKEPDKPTSQCMYQAVSGTQGCAIGRHLIGSEEDKAKWDEIGAYDNIVCVIKQDSLPDIRPEWMKSMDHAFLNSVQILHDRGGHWIENNLSVDGKNYLGRIISNFNLDISKFSKFL